MLSSPMLMIPPLAAVVAALFFHPPKKTELAGSLMISLSVCLLIFALGRRFERDDPASIKRDYGGIVTITNSEIKTGRTCLIYVDEGALGGEYGKEVRKFLFGADFETCVVVNKVGSFDIPKTKIERADLIILSGITIEQVEIREGPAKYILLNPAFLPGYMPSEPIQSILYPEINRPQHLGPEVSSLIKFQSKIRMVPFNEHFETSWSEYTH
jgi:hypothetical protein